MEGLRNWDAGANLIGLGGLCNLRSKVSYLGFDEDMPFVMVHVGADL